MTNKQTTRRLFTVLLMLLLGTFCPAALVRAQKPAAAKASSPAGGPKEGIKVHGNWTIDIRNPDGKLVSHHEFKNALTGAGAIVLGLFLQRTSKVGLWELTLDSSATSLYPCADFFGGPAPCLIREPEAVYSPGNLTISSDGRTNGGTLLAGTATAQRTGDIAKVQATLSHCPVGTQGTCGVDTSVFTRTQLATPINVVAGQIIQVTVVISFS